MRMPPSAASDVPIAQASIEMRSGRAPFRVESERSSTAARIAMPMRVRVRSRRSPMATRIATRDRDGLVHRDGGRAEVDRLARREERLHRPAHAGLPDQLREPDEEQQQGDRDDELDRFGGVLQAAHDDELEQHAEQRREHQQHERECDGRRPPPVEAQLPVDEREQHPGRTVGEVEDAGRRVREDEPAGEDRVDGRDGEADDREGQELVHGSRLPRPATSCS